MATATLSSIREVIAFGGFTLEQIGAVMDTFEENERLLASRQTRPAQIVTENQFIQIVEGLDGATPAVTLYNVTKYVPGNGATKKHRETKVVADECFSFPIGKSYTIRTMLGLNYAKLVNKVTTDIKFEAQERTNGLEDLDLGDGKRSRYFCQKLVKDGGLRIYLKVNISAKMRWNKMGVQEDSRWFDNNGAELTEAQIADLKAGFLDKPTVANRQLDAGVDEADAVEHMTPLLSNIQFAVLNGVVYAILHG